MDKQANLCHTERFNSLPDQSWEFTQPTPTYLSGLSSEVPSSREPSLTTKAGSGISTGSSSTLGSSHHNPDHSAQYSPPPPLPPMNSVFFYYYSQTSQPHTEVEIEWSTKPPNTHHSTLAVTSFLP